MCLIVPVRNEAHALAATLASVATQRTLHGAPFDLSRLEVLVLANNCTDDSAAVARACGRAHPGLTVHVEEVQLPPAQAHIGHVRALLMDAACDRLACTAQGAYVVSTDGDTVAHPHWLACTLQAFEAGADVVGGRILLDPQVPLDLATLRHHRCDTAHRLAQSRLEALIDPDPADPWPRHHQHFGASLALRSRAYRQVGGIPAVRYLEDVALVDACRLADLRVRHCPLVRVWTSPRRVGRVEVGLSWQLQQWAQHAQDDMPMRVENPDGFVARVQRRRRLREAWHAEMGPLHEGAATFGARWAQTEPGEADGVPYPGVPVREAIDRLKSLIRLHAEGGPPCVETHAKTRAKTSIR